MSTKGSKNLNTRIYEDAALLTEAKSQNTQGKTAGPSQSRRIVVQSNQNTIIVKVEPSKIRRQELMRKLNSKR